MSPDGVGVDHGPAEVIAALIRLGLAAPGDAPAFTALTGGISSDIWRVELPGGPVCVKRALAELRVDAHWQAPVERNLYEARWMRRAGAVVPEAVPELLGQDQASGVLVMAYLAPEDHGLWKARLRDGLAEPEVAAEVASRLVRIHSHTALDSQVATDFPTDRIFYSIRLEPYLLATATAHPDRAAALESIAAETARTKYSLVHGDVSPKNILIGPKGPLFLDAECAWYGDPAFDLAFCANHLLLKCLWTPAAATGFLACFETLTTHYLAGVDWEAPEDLEHRAARLLPGLFLGRVDGKSPVEYVTKDADKARVRKVGRALLAEPPARLADVATAWHRELSL